MGLVSEILSNGGTLPQLEELLGKKSTFLTRKNGLLFSLLWFIFFVLILTPFWAIVEVEEMAAMSAVTGVFGGLLIFLFSLFFLGKAPKKLNDFVQSQSDQQLPGGVQHGALPPHMQQSADEYAAPGPGTWKAPDTGELVAPGSVTEGTTKLLKKEEESK
ncbi:MAG: hypothetical protein DWQ47_04350 [Acidobacteria bacterium]|nr:MAG: hypothetical protein DWQ32_07900 [Acidobacteriota bacterium]REK01623.1 MAG: hypothetical protein DWQ38_04335 [Acidobacteriota bacterium]REK14579.1 MAG: hypothetical protein DWQ43_13590 [Acidobacteriota bacterium]REK45294.1 MAG: hypothetical protein DWQ47_04350 [Acidobacteriota bacterium]